MPQSVMYHSVTGEIRSAYRASSAGLLRKQQARQGWALLEVETHLEAEALVQYAVVDGVLTAKTAAVITASRTPFPPDGVSSCTVSLAPFVPCTLRVNGTTYALTAEDPDLVLTADVPTTFVISLVWLVSHWAAPITVQAQTWVPVAVTDVVSVTDGLGAWWSNILRALGVAEMGVVEPLPVPTLGSLPLASQTPLALAESVSLSVQVAPRHVGVVAQLGVSGTVLPVHLPVLPLWATTALRVGTPLATVSLAPGAILALEAVSLLGTVPVRLPLRLPSPPVDCVGLHTTALLRGPALARTVVTGLGVTTVPVMQTRLAPVQPTAPVALVDPVLVHVLAPATHWDVSVADAVTWAETTTLAEET